MAICAKLGIPHSEFLSWPDEEQDKHLALYLHEQGRCPHCGTVPDDWLDDDGEYIEPPPYVAVSHLCGGCQTIQDKIAEIPEKDRGKYHVTLQPRSVSESNRKDRAPG